MSEIIDHYHDVRQDVLETFIDRGQLRQLAEPTVLPSGRRIPICVAFLKLFERIYAPLTAELLAPFRGDRALADQKRCALDRLYQRITDYLDVLLHAVGLKVAA